MTEVLIDEPDTKVMHAQLDFASIRVLFCLILGFMAFTKQPQYLTSYVIWNTARFSEKKKQFREGCCSVAARSREPCPFHMKPFHPNPISQSSNMPNVYGHVIIKAI
jgi:hypothetical protein